jgi:hypothetical protein
MLESGVNILQWVKLSKNVVYLQGPSQRVSSVTRGDLTSIHQQSGMNH